MKPENATFFKFTAGFDSGLRISGDWESACLDAYRSAVAAVFEGNAYPSSVATLIAAASSSAYFDSMPVHAEDAIKRLADIARAEMLATPADVLRAAGVSADASPEKKVRSLLDYQKRLDKSRIAGLAVLADAMFSNGEMPYGIDHIVVWYQTRHDLIDKTINAIEDQMIAERKQALIESVGYVTKYDPDELPAEDRAWMTEKSALCGSGWTNGVLIDLWNIHPGTDMSAKPRDLSQIRAPEDWMACIKVDPVAFLQRKGVHLTILKAGDRFFAVQTQAWAYFKRHYSDATAWITPDKDGKADGDILYLKDEDGLPVGIISIFKLDIDGQYIADELARNF